jgi:hypothetical protein
MDACDRISCKQQIAIYNIELKINMFHNKLKETEPGLMLWHKPVILAFWEVEIGKIVIQGQVREEVHETVSQPMVGYSGVCLTFQLHKEA